MPKYIAVNAYNGIKVLEVSKILYLKSSGRYTSIYLNDKTKILVCKNLGYYEKLFENNYFLRIHNSFVVNVSYLKNIIREGDGQYCILSENNIIPISNRRFSHVKEFLYY
ncbi:LytTR family DNA-binding domain-containing protein [Mariniflexile litorale]|uniref:LytTR family DNA-binding domain-containing protein n=1 Tax=Mariniflexile litorale TaxID=3045158 RepID=A0AAU7EHI7_9FLAO|nr:LytTR family DNA-binding domain-containing protein [Mariniflexile sp. KMM 9835]MDQ8209934.1 LytTR family DNA-binding domain-containing protein [Mariniflexile sp. KMM 9835]